MKLQFMHGLKKIVRLFLFPVSMDLGFRAAKLYHIYLSLFTISFCTVYPLMILFSSSNSTIFLFFGAISNACADFFYLYSDIKSYHSTLKIPVKTIKCLDNLTLLLNISVSHTAICSLQLGRKNTQTRFYVSTYFGVFLVSS